MKRYKHSLSHYKLLTCDQGELVPVGLVEALPGDTIQQSTSILLRMSPMVAPVMHPVQVRLHHFFVPNRLIYTGWEDFITGGPDGTGSTVPYPTNAAAINPATGSLLDYLGVPPGTSLPIGALSMLPVRAYNLIYNEFYRDQDLVTEVAQDSTVLQRISWEKDYFTTCRPWTQKGPAVTLPLGTSAPVDVATTDLYTGTKAAGMRWRQAVNGNVAPDGDFLMTGSGNGSTQNFVGSNVGSAILYPANLFADLSSATAAQINDLRRALALQRYQEARAQYGSRYTEYLRYLGVKSADQRLDRPEYLGGGKQTVAFSEVLRTGSDTATSPVGDLKGHGIAALRSNRYRYFVEEHGYIMTLLSIRPRSMYVQGLPRTFTRRTKEDYYQKELELIGQQQVFNRELFMAGTAADNNIFGYQDRYAEYRHENSKVSGEFRGLLNYWHEGRIFASQPTLNQSFVECDPGKRIFAVQTNDTCWCMVNHNIQARRMVGHQTIGRIL